MKAKKIKKDEQEDFQRKMNDKIKE
jgi:hypothetical protein